MIGWRMWTGECFWAMTTLAGGSTHRVDICHPKTCEKRLVTRRSTSECIFIGTKGFFAPASGAAGISPPFSDAHPTWGTKRFQEKFQIATATFRVYALDQALAGHRVSGGCVEGGWCEASSLCCDVGCSPEVTIFGEPIAPGHQLDSRFLLPCVLCYWAGCAKHCFSS